MTPRERVHSIVRDVAAEYEVAAKDIFGTTRLRPAAWARQEVFRRLNDFGYSLSWIGRVFDRDHTTVLHGVRAARTRAEMDWQEVKLLMRSAATHYLARLLREKNQRAREAAE